MISDLKQIGTELAAELGRRPTERTWAVLKEFLTEVESLSRLDFAPDARADFLRARGALRSATRTDGVMATIVNRQREAVSQMTALLERYGPSAMPASRSFRWLSDADLRRIVERDYVELHSALLPSGAWKSTVIMAGSITEAILFDLLTKDPARLRDAKASPASKDDNGNQIATKDWKLHHLIAIATAINLLPKARAGTFDQVLRDYRNFVHPSKELRSAHPHGEGEALMSKGALDALCDHFDRTLP